MQTAHATDAPMSGLTPSQILFRAAHRARLARIAEAAARRKPQVCKTRDYQPFVTDVVEIVPPQPETPEQWAARQKAIPIPSKPYEPWFHIEAEIKPPRNIRMPTVEAIQRASADHFGIARIDILSARRTAIIVRPRQVSMYLAKKLTTRSLPDIGRRTGGRDHTTILHAVRKIAALIERDADLAQDVARIEAAVMGGGAL